jgi:hypothetical protein
MNERLRSAGRLYGAVILRLVADRPDDNDLATLTRAAELLRGVMDATEEGAAFEKAHGLLDNVGSLINEHFADKYCCLAYENSGYYRVCPVDLAHLRMGLSIGFSTRRAECSICGQDPEECEHVRGFTYDGATCYRRVVEADVHEVSLVDRPAQPEARITSWPVAISDLRQAFPDEFKPGVRIACNKCAAGCPGLTRPLLGI